MKGRVSARREAMIRIQVEGARGKRRVITGIIDTGFDGSLTLPLKTIRQLKLQRIGQRQCELADGSVINIDFFAARIAWNRRMLAVEVNEAQTFPLIGMELLDGQELNIRVRPNDAVTIRPLPLKLRKGKAG